MWIDWITVSAAALSGVLGGAHCAAMCGGIATSFSTLSGGHATGVSSKPMHSWWRAAQPNLGRVGGYTLAGLIAGGFGAGIVDLANSPALLFGMRALVGVVMILAGLRLLDRSGRFAPLARPGMRLWSWMRPLQKRLLPANTPARRIGLGLLWGWMPCGLSTTLLTAVWFQADPLNGALTMLAFGLGTLPLMLPLTWSGQRLGQRLQRGGWRLALGGTVLASGLLTLSAPWLMRVPELQGFLGALGCTHPGA